MHMTIALRVVRECLHVKRNSPVLRDVHAEVEAQGYRDFHQLWGCADGRDFSATYFQSKYH